MKFAEKFATKIGSVKIGHKNFLGNGDFKLSNSFCEGLVKSLPNLAELELYYVGFLDRNRDILSNLKEVKLHPSRIGTINL